MKNTHSIFVRFFAVWLVTSLTASPLVFAESDNLSDSQRQELISKGFQKGKTLYDKGEYVEANAAWSEIEPYLEDSSSVKKVISFLRARAGKKMTKALPKPKPASVHAPASVAVVAAAEPVKASPSPKAAESSVSLAGSLGVAEETVESQIREAAGSAPSVPPSPEFDPAVEKAIEKGKTYLSAGRIAQALVEWESAAAKLPDSDALKIRLDRVRERLAELDRVKREAAEPVSAAPVAFDTTSLERSLDAAAKRLTDDIAAEEARIASARKASADQPPSELEESFRKGSDAFAAGNYAEAIRQWKIAARLPEAPVSIGASVEKLEQSYADLEAARKTRPEAAQPPVAPVAEFQDFLASADRRLAAELDEARASLEQSAKPQKEREAAVRAAFEKGKLAYYQGRVEEAIGEWGAMAPLVQDGAKLKARLAAMKKSVDDAASARQAASSSESAPSPPSPAEFMKLLDQAAEKFRADLIEIEARKSRLEDETERAARERRRRLEDAKALFDLGRRVEALEAWEAAAAEAGSSPAVTARLAELRKLDRRAAELATTSSSSRPKLPADEIASYLTEAAKQIERETARLESERTAFEKSYSERQAAIDASFEKGKALYGQGRFGEAAEEWRRAAVFVGEKSEALPRIDALKANYEKAEAAKREAEKALSSKDVSLKTPTGFLETISDADRALSGRLADAQAQKRSAEAAREDRERALVESLRRGKELFDGGKTREGLAEWRRASKFIDDPAFLKRLTALESSAAQLEQVAASTKSAASQKLAAPAGLSDLIENASAALGERAGTEEERRRAAEKTLAERKNALASVSDKVSKLTAEGRAAEAAKELARIEPYLADDDARGRIRALAERADALEKTHRDAAEATASQNKLAAPAGLTRSAEELAKRLTRDLEAAQREAAAAQRSIDERRRWVEQKFAAGKVALDAGDWQSAAREWEATLPHLNPSAAEPLKKLLAARDQAAAARRLADESARQSERIEPPPSLAAAFADAERAVTEESSRAASEKQRFDKLTEDRRASLLASVQNGKTLFAKADYRGALDEWKKLAPYLKDGSDAEKALSSLVAAERSLAAAKKAAVVAAASEYKGLELPASALTPLSGAARALDAEAKQAEERLSALSRSQESRRAEADAAMKRGQAFFEEGKTDQALREWASVEAYMAPDSDFARRLAEVKSARARADAANTAALAAQKSAVAPVPPPAGSDKALAAAAAKFAETESAAAARRTAAEAAKAARQKDVETAMREAAELSASGRQEEAVRRWESALPNLAKDSEVATAIEAVRVARDRANAAAAAAKGASERLSAPIEAPAGAMEALRRAQEAIATESRASLEKKNASEKALEETRRRFTESMRRAAELYKTGKVSEALGEWQAASTLAHDGGRLTSAVQSARKDYESAETASRQASELATRAAAGFEITPEMAAAFDGAVKTLADSKTKDEARRVEIVRSVDAKRQAVSQALQKGKELLAQGKPGEAIQVWETVVAETADERAAAARLDAVKKAAAEAAAARRAADEFASTEFKDLKIKNTEVFTGLLTDAEKRLRESAERHASQKAEMEGALKGRQEWISATFQKGKMLYDAGKLEEAFDLWEKILPYMENEREIRLLLQQAFQSYRKSEEARKAAEEAGKKTKLAAPAGFIAALSDSSKKLEAEAASHAERRRAAEGEADTHRLKSEAARAEASDAFEKGNYAAAVAAWRRATAEYADAPALAATLKALEDASARAISERAAADALVKAAKSAPAPAALRTSLEEAARRAAELAKKESERKASADAAAKARRESVDRGVQEGKRLFQAGEAEKAFDAWAAAAAETDGAVELGRLLAAARASYRAGSDTAKAAREAESAATAKLPVPAGLSDMLEQAKAELEKEAAAVSSERDKAKQAVTDRAARVTSTVEKGKQLYASGRTTEAVAAWRSILPELADAGRISSALEAVSRADEARAAARGTAKAAAEAASQKLPSPPGFDAFLEDASTRYAKDKSDAMAEMERLKGAVSERQAWVAQTFQRAKELFGAGNDVQAVTELDKLSPYLGDSVKEKLIAVKENLRASVEAKKAAVEYATNEYKQSPVLAESARVLDEMRASLQAKTTQAVQERFRLQAATASRRDLFQAGVTEAGRHVAAGEPDKALAVWAAMAAKLGENAPEKKSVEEIRVSIAAAAEARRAAAQAAHDAAAPIELSAASKSFLADISSKLADSAKSSAASRAASEKELAARRAALAAAFDESRRLFGEGKPDDAVAALSRAAKIAGPQAQELVTSLIESRRSASADRAAAQAASHTPVQPPQGFDEALRAASAAAVDEASAAASQKAAALEAVSKRRVANDQHFFKGQQLLEAGKIDEALQAWDSLLAAVDDPSAWKGKIAAVRASLEEAQRARASIPPADRRVPAPEGFDAYLAQAKQRFEKQASASVEARRAAEAGFAARSAAMQASFEKGKALAAEGRYEEAFSEWDLLAKAADTEELRQAVEAVRQSERAAREAKAEADRFSSEEYARIKRASPEFAKALESAAVSLDAETAKAEARRAEMEKTLAERRRWLDDAFQKGKELYESGRYDDAAAMWSGMLPHLENERELRLMLDRLSEARQRAIAAAALAAQAERAKDTKLKSPDALAAFLDASKKSVEAQAEAERARKEAAEKALEDKRNWIAFTFQDGKNLYQSGKVDEALAVWRKLEPHLDNGAELKEQLDRFAATRAAALKAKAAAQAALAEKPSFKTPEDIPLLLAMSEQKLKDETAALEAERLKREDASRREERRIREIFEKGKALYAAGQYAEAVKQWKSIAPSLADSAEILSESARLLETEARSEAARRAADQMRAQRFAAPTDLASFLREADAKLREEAQAAEAEKNRALDDLRARQNKMQDIFQRGKDRYFEGDYEGALKEWTALSDFLEPGSQAAELLNQIAKNLTVAATSKQENQILGSKFAQEKAPAELMAFLGQANEALKKEALEAQAEKLKAEMSLQQRQLWIREAFEKGKGLYNQGLYKEAVDEWSKLAPYTDDSASVMKLMESVRIAAEDTTLAKKSAVEAVASEYKGLRADYAPQIIDLLQRAGDKLKAEISEYDKKRKETESTLAERKEWTITTFNKGKLLYDQGRVDEAIDQWERLAPYLDDEGKERLESLKDQYNRFLTAQSQSGQADKAAAVDISSIQAFFKEAAMKLDSQAADERKKAETARNLFQKRSEWVKNTFEKGKRFYEEGKYSDAAREWDILKPYLAGDAEMQEYVAHARMKAAELEEARAASDEASARLSSVPAIPAVTEEETKQAAQERQAKAEAGSKELAAALESGEFVSGEVTSVNKTDSSITMKLYSVDKVKKDLTIQFDKSTKIDGAAAGDTSVEAGNAIDLRYDPQTKKATYIYVY